jgi:voltage-gated potassium channel
MKCAAERAYGRSKRRERETARVSEETKLERRLGRWLARAVTPRGAAVIIATASTAMTIAAGLLMTVVDRSSFPTVGAGLWWAAQTVTTVGYGDHVPQSVAGQLVAVLVMLFGIGFLTVITAAITSTFVSRSRRELAPSDAESQAAEQLRQINRRLERIEATLTDSS